MLTASSKVSLENSNSNPTLRELPSPLTVTDGVLKVTFLSIVKISSMQIVKHLVNILKIGG
jgi:hypothetical protein